MLKVFHLLVISVGEITIPIPIFQAANLLNYVELYL